MCNKSSVKNKQENKNGIRKRLCVFQITLGQLFIMRIVHYALLLHGTHTYVNY